MKKLAMLISLLVVVTSCRSLNTSFVQAAYDPTIKTVEAVFDYDGSLLFKHKVTYKTRLDLKKGDHCVIKSEYGFDVVKVVKVHETPAIRHNSRKEYPWITNKVDTPPIEAAERQDRKDAAKIRRTLNKEHVTRKLGEGFKL